MNIDLIIQRLVEARKKFLNPEQCVGFIDIDGRVIELEEIKALPGTEAISFVGKKSKVEGPVDDRKKVVGHRWEGLKCIITLECGCETFRYRTHLAHGIPKQLRCKECQP